MTSNTSSIQSVSKPLDHPTTHHFQHPIRPLLRHRPKSGTEDYPPRSDAEPVFKKQRIDQAFDHVVPSRASQVQQTISAGNNQRPRPSEQTSTTLDQSFLSSSISPSTAPLLFRVRSNSDLRQDCRHNRSVAFKRNSQGPGEVQIKPFIPKAPAPTPRYSLNHKSARSQKDDSAPCSHLLAGKNAADFSLWSGNHPEDVLSESTIKQGYYDKIQVSQAESSTARPSIWGSLKHKSGLQVLSSLVISVLDKRQAHGTTTAGCTFKPPPRVTLTDSKREAWLRDLSNPTIPLRRLSRTIPHGIRGRTLLDHSLAKDIPTARSIWLAKCVGANEIRASKRKGASGAFAAGGETKWIKEWTASVEQFVDAIISTCGSQDWRANLDYSLRLATHLLAEGLLDRDHYFGWMLDAVDQSDLELLSINLLIVSTHLQEIGRTRRSGSRLAESLLGQLRKIACHPSPDLYQALRSEIADIINLLIISSPASFLLPKRWQEYESTLQPLMEIPGVTFEAQFRNLCKRNMRLQTLAGSNPDCILTAKLKIINILDSLSLGAPISTAARSLRSIADDPEILVYTCLEWSASVYRYGRARSYLAARLLRRWAEMGVDVETHMLTFLADELEPHELETTHLYVVFIELIQSRHFSVSRYFQWVIANGLLRGYHQSKTGLSHGVGLILEIPLHGLPAHIVNLRGNLLRSVGASAEVEKRTIARRIAFIERQLRGKDKGHGKPTDFYHPLPGFSRETLSVRLSIGRWIRKETPTFPKAQQAVDDHSPQDSASSHLSPPQSCPDFSRFRILLQALEELEDFQTMADVLSHYSSSDDPQLLTDVTVTISHYLDVFVGIGTANTLLAHLFQQHAVLICQPTIVPFTRALVDLSGSLPNCISMNRALRKYLQNHVSQQSVAACSPVSEHMAEALQANDSTSLSAYTDEVEQLLTNGTSLDKRSLHNIFESIWKRFEATWIDSMESSFATASLISRLALFNKEGVNELMTIWIDKTIGLGSRPKLIRLGIPLICSRAISLEQFLSQTIRHLQDKESSVPYSGLAVELLDFLVADREKAEASINFLRYRFYNEQQHFLRRFSPMMVTILQHVLRHAHTVPNDSVVHIARLLQNGRFLSLLRTLPESHTPDTGGIDSVLGSFIAMQGAAHTLRIIATPARNEEWGNSTQSRSSSVLKHVSVLSLPFDRLHLQAILSNASKEGGTATHHLISVMLDEVSTTSTIKVKLWSKIISSLPPEQRNTICSKAEDEFFAILSRTFEPYSDRLLKHLECLLSVIGIYDNDRHDATSATRILVQIHEKLAQTVLIGCPPRLSGKTEPPATNVSENSWALSKLDALLRLLHIHQSAFEIPNVSDSVVTQLLLLLYQLYNFPFPVPYTHLRDDLYDFLTVLSDSVSPAIQAQCIRTLDNQPFSIGLQLRYVFGSYGTPEDSWLQLLSGSGLGEKLAQRPFPIRRWETMADATPLMTENDTSVSLTFFGARKAVL